MCPLPCTHHSDFVDDDIIIIFFFLLVDFNDTKCVWKGLCQCQGVDGVDPQH